MAAHSVIIKQHGYGDDPCRPESIDDGVALRIEESDKQRMPLFGLNNNNNNDESKSCPAINIEFSDLSYTVPIGRNDSKVLLRNISGLFKSSQLTAIMGTSGSGKSTLLNILAGYKTGNSNGTILINGCQRDINKFRKLSRYIMQDDLLQPNITSMESMKIAAHLKLGTTVSSKQKYMLIEEILTALRLTKIKNTVTSHLSGGEKKRLSIALELVNNPPVIFLDEPTTGLDDVASNQCVSILKMLASGGHTIVCSVHTPSARIFSTFDHIYLLSEGQCVFAGQSDDVVPYLSTLGLQCPLHYNPADFAIEVSNREYGDYTKKMVMTMDNGRCYRWNSSPVSEYKQCTKSITTEKQEDNNNFMHSKGDQKYNLYDFNSSSWFQFNVLMYRIFLQTWRDREHVLLKCLMYSFTGFMMGALYFRMGNDATKTLFNFGYCFVTNIVFMYIPMLPVLLNFPSEVLLLKREHFNRWYGLNAYFCAQTVSKIPVLCILCMFYVVISYIMSDQPLEAIRILKFTIICLYIAVISESLGYAISAQLNVVNSIFVGPALSVPFMLLAIYGLGTGSEHIPMVIRIGMYSSYLRYGVEGLVLAIYGDDRQRINCPDAHCDLRYPERLLVQVGMEKANYWVDLAALTFMFVLFKVICYVLLKRRLSTTPSSLALSYVGRFVKTHFTLTR